MSVADASWLSLLQEQGESAVSVLPVRIAGAEGVAFENTFHAGVKRETLRSLCQLVNGSQLPLEVALTTGMRSCPDVRTAAITASPPFTPMPCDRAHCCPACKCCFMFAK